MEAENQVRQGNVDQQGFQRIQVEDEERTNISLSSDVFDLREITAAKSRDTLLVSLQLGTLR